MGKWNFRTGGIPDEMFIRGQVPMTKSEVRAITIAKARLRDTDVIWDIGAGTGSISVEAALTVVNGRVCAVEKDEEALQLINRNIELFGTDNITVCSGAAPAALAGLPGPDRVFIGGSGGNLEAIIRHVHREMPVGGRVVINAVVLETLVTTVKTLESLGLEDMDITQVSVSKAEPLGTMHMFKSHNPVFVISAEKRCELVVGS